MAVWSAMDDPSIPDSPPAPPAPPYRILTCVYCGAEYPQHTPTWDSAVLTDHIRICPAHPMSLLQRKHDALLQHYKLVRGRLEDRVGARTKADLEELAETHARVIDSGIMAEAFTEPHSRRTLLDITVLLRTYPFVDLIETDAADTGTCGSAPENGDASAP